MDHDCAAVDDKYICNDCNKVDMRGKRRHLSDCEKSKHPRCQDCGLPDLDHAREGCEIDLSAHVKRDLERKKLIQSKKEAKEPIRCCSSCGNLNIEEVTIVQCKGCKLGKCIECEPDATNQCFQC